MTHIEFTGVTGAGKSALFHRLLDSDGYYGGYADGGVERTYHPSIKKLANLAPNVVSVNIERMVWLGVADAYYEEFVAENIDIASKAAELVDREKERASTLTKRVAQQYQLGRRTVRSGEVHILDEGFYHRAISLAVRTDGYEIPDEEYFRRIPTPQALIHVSPSNESIRERYQLRDREPFQAQELAKDQDLLDDILGVAYDHGVRVMQVKNERPAAAVVEQLKEELDQQDRLR